MRALAILAGVAVAAGALGLACTGPTRAYGPAVGGGGAGAGASSLIGGGGSAASTMSAGGTGGVAGMGGAGGGGSGAGGEIACGTGHTCVPGPPVGWTGPILFTEALSGDSIPGCLGDYPTEMGDELFETLDEGNVSCSCTCTVKNIVCSSDINGCYKNQCFALGCSSPFSLPPNACSHFSDAAGGFIDFDEPQPDDPGSCTPKLDNTVTHAKFKQHGVACDGATTTIDGCPSGDLCAPSATTKGKLCIAQAGTAASCPDPYFSELHPLFAGVTDDRDCAACTCGDAVSTCGGRVDFTHGPSGGCTGSVFFDSSIQAHNCGTNDKQTSSAATYVTEPSGSCPKMGGGPTGSFETDGAITLCCH